MGIFDIDGFLIDLSLNLIRITEHGSQSVRKTGSPEVCEDQRANSPMSAAIDPVPLEGADGGACLVSAASPVVNASALTETAINLNWVIPGGLGDCNFLSFTVEVTESARASSYYSSWQVL